jgi:hypothetical protein
VALLWLSNALLFFSQMSFSYASVVAFYRGSEEAFTQPRSFKVLLEISHFHLFAMGILILTMTHLVLFAPVGVRTKAWLIVTSFAGALADEGAGWLVRFVHPGFAWMKLAGFLTLQVSLALMLGIVTWAVWTTPPNNYRGG